MSPSASRPQIAVDGQAQFWGKIQSQDRSLCNSQLAKAGDEDGEDADIKQGLAMLGNMGLGATGNVQEA